MRRILAILLSLSMVLTCMAGITFTTSAALTVGSVELSGEGSTAAPYIIDSPAKFIAVFGDGNTNTATTHASGVVYHLTTNIDLSTGYTPNTATFKGTLMGADEAGNPVKREINLGTKTITTGVAHKVSNKNYIKAGGLFVDTDSAKISYLILKGNLTFSTSNFNRTGALAAYVNKGTVSYVDNYTNVTGKVEAGGLIGRLNAGAINNCVNYGTASGTTGGVGGLIGLTNGSASSIISCGNQGAVSATSHVGGITGYGYCDIKNSYNTGAITSTMAGGLAGGIVGYTATKGITMIQCWNSGAITADMGASEKSGAGGITGGDYAVVPTSTKPARPTNIKNCFNVGELSGIRIGAANGNVYNPGGKFQGFYDIANTGAPLYSTGYQSGPESVESVYIASGQESTADDGTKYASYETIAALTESDDAYFSVSSVWTMREGYSFPQLVENPYFGNDIEIPQGNVFEVNQIAGAGTKASPYIIDSVDKFKAVFSSANGETELTHADGVYYLQTEDLNVGAFTPLYGVVFLGTYQGGTIEGGVITLSNKVINITINGGSEEGVAIFPDYNKAEFSHITVDGSVTGGKFTAGLAGNETSGGSKFTSIINKAKISGASHAAGIAAIVRSGGTITDCINEGEVTLTSSQYAGGIVGWANTKIVITNCHNKAPVTAASSYAGGISGVGYATSYINCSNTGAIKAGAGYAGGLTGGFQTVLDQNDAKYYTVKGCWNSGTVDGGTGTAGGLIGATILANKSGTTFSAAPMSFTDCFNAGKIKSSNGKIAGLVYQVSGKGDYTEHNYSYTISNFYDASSTADSIGLVQTYVPAANITIQNNFAFSPEEVEFDYSEYVTEAEIKALITSGKLSSDLWQVNATYGIPEIKENPYTGDDSSLFPLPLFAGGSGTATDPYQVANANHFANIANEPTAYYVQTENFTVTEMLEINFRGNYDGNGKTIIMDIETEGVKDNAGLLDANKTINAGLFAYLGGDITGLTLDGKLVCTSTERSGVGGLAGGISANSVQITNCVNKAKITSKTANGNSRTGGFIGNGYKQSLVITNCKNYGDITASNGYVSGIITVPNTGSKIENCANFGDITVTSTGTCYAAGISSWTYQATYKNCYNFGRISAVKAGGVLGVISRTISISDCFNAGAVVGTDVSTCFGYDATTTDSYTLTISNCYNIWPDAKIGEGAKTITGCYTLSSIEETGVTKVTSAELEALTLTNFTKASDNTANESYNKSYPYPQLSANLIPSDYVYIAPQKPFEGGTGTEEDPYLIATAEQFNNINNAAVGGLNKFYKQIADIGTVTTQVGAYNVAFKGGYDGQGYAINVDLVCDDTDATCFALFNFITSATIKNVVVTGKVKVGAAVPASEGIGAIIGKVTADTGAKCYITNCVNKAEVVSEATHNKATQVAGVVARAFNNNVEIRNCVNYGDITSKTRASGICGVTNVSTVLDGCINYGTITAPAASAGIISWTYGSLSNCANFGTIVATNAGGYASGIVTFLQSGNNVFDNCFNAGTLYGGSTAGIAIRGTNNVAYTVSNSYNMVFADHPIADAVTSFSEVPTLVNCYFLSEDSAVEALTGSTKVGSLDGMKTINLGDAYEVKASSAYKYPVLKALKYDEDKIAVDYVKVTSELQGSEWCKNSITNFTFGAPFYVTKGFDGLKLFVNPNDDYWKAKVLVNGVEIAQDIINEGSTIALTALTEDTNIVVLNENFIANGEDLPTVTTDPETYAKLLSEETELIGGVTASKFALIIGKAPKSFGYRIKEYGVIVGNSADVTMESATFKAAITDNAKMNPEMDYAYGTLLYGDNLQANREYFVKAYAVYTNGSSEEYTVLGDATTFALEAAE